MSTNENKVKEAKKKVAVDKRSVSLKYISIFSVVILIVIVLAFNILVDGLLGDKMKFDLSTAGQNSISDTTKSFLDAFPEGKTIRVVGLFDLPDNYSKTPLEYTVPLLEDYAKQSDGKVTVEYINPDNYPYIIAELDPTGVYDLGKHTGYYAVCYEGKIELISPADDCFLYEDVYNQNTGYTNTIPVSNISESAFTNAMINLTSGYSNKAYILQPMNDTNTNEQISIMLKNMGIEVETLYYGDADFKVPSDCDLLILSCVSHDITENMGNQIDAYLTNGGKVIVTTDFAHSVLSGTNLKNLNTLVLNLRGINLESYMVMETDTNYLIPSSGESTPEFIAQPASEGVAMLGDSDKFHAYWAMGVNKVNTKYESSMTVSPLLVTSNQAVRYDIGEDQKLAISGTNSQYNIAMCSVGNSEKNSFELYVFGISTGTDDEFVAQYGFNYPNVVLIRGIIKNTLNVNDSHVIASKELNNYSIDTSKMNLNSSSAMIVILVAVVPLAFIIAGTVVYTRRKNL